jgi:shikimate kinase/3-dehydroquinate synthase
MYPGDSENLILTGFMGTGKTAVGQQLAQVLSREFVDMDALIEAREGVTVTEIFAQQGEAHFRQLEARICCELAARSGLVIATGGGALIPDENYEILSASGPVVCLTATLDEILNRLAAVKDRPLLDVPDRRTSIAALLDARTDAYGRIPFQVDTTRLAVTQIAERTLTVVKAPVAKIIPVRTPGGEYSVHLGRGLLAQTGRLLQEEGLDGQVALVTNPTVGDLYAATVIESLEAAGFHTTICTVPDGESYKTLDTVQTLYDSLTEAGLDRQGAVLALGGGVLGDMAGFAAATYLRGVALVQLPTTLLAMVDASVGGKVAVDHPRGKNLIGAFKQPELVIADPNVLTSLPQRETGNGLAEVIKAGIIGDPGLFKQVKAHGPAPLFWLIERAIKLKVAVVEGDPYEQGRRAILNLGHTFGHALELLSGYALSHGAAVSVGMVAAARLSAHLGFCMPALASHTEAVLTRLGLPTTFHDHTPLQVWQAMAADKKRRGKILRFVLPRAVGDVFVTDQVEQVDVLAVLGTLRET